MKLIQQYSSRFETPKVQISNEAYDAYGTKIFFQEKIPFADRTGSKFAKEIVKLLITRLSDPKVGKLFKNSFVHIYEFGAGTGILAKRILDLLAKKFPGFYAKIVLHISDISAKAIAELNESEIFVKHKNHIVFDVMDAINPVFAKKPFMVYFTDLIATLPCRHIQTLNGQILEIQVQTVIDDSSQTIDVTKFPPKVVSGSNISSLVYSKNTLSKLTLAPQFTKLFKEEYKKIPIDELDNINAEEKKDLKNLCANFTNDRIFNYCYAAKKCIKECLEALGPGGFILLSDFGTASKETSELSLWVEYGITICFTVDFYGLMKNLKSSKAGIHLASNISGGPQELLIDTYKDNKFAALFKKLFGWNFQSKVDAYLSDAKNVLFSQIGEKKKVAKIKKMLLRLPKEARKDYLLLNDVAYFLQMNGHYHMALKYCNLLKKEYQHTKGAYYYLIKGQAYQSLGKLDLAEQYYKKAVYYNNPSAIASLGNLYLFRRKFPDHIESLKNYITYTRNSDYLKNMYYIALTYEKMMRIAKANNSLKNATNFAKCINFLSEEDRSILQEIKDKTALFDAKSSVDNRQNKRAKVWDNKSITILLGHQATPWVPAGLINPKETFLGGSEEAVVYLSRELAKLGWNVTVYAEPRNKEGIKNGVTWLNYYHFNPKDVFNILIMWRYAWYIDLNCKARQKYYWTHDVQSDLNFSQKRLDKIDKIIVLSRAHRTNLPKTPDDKIFISSNGFFEHYPKLKPKNKSKLCIYTSSYDRGLEHLLAIWPKVLREVPESELHIFYGWQMFDKISQFYDYNSVSEWKRQMISLMRQPGVTDHGRVSQTELERWYKKCGILAYPSHFFEISCISAMKAQAYGAIPVTTTVGALDETVQFGIKIRGDVNKKSVLEKYKEALIDSLKNRRWQKKQRQLMTAWAKKNFSWKKVALQWDSQFKLFKKRSN